MACTPQRTAHELFLSSDALSHSGADLNYPSCILFTQDIVVKTLAFPSWPASAAQASGGAGGNENRDPPFCPSVSLFDVTSVNVIDE